MSDDFEKMMKELREEYVQSLPLKIIEIDEHLKSQMWPDLRNDFHKLKGTGRTYGVPEISTLCEAVEKICVKKPDMAAAIVPSAIYILKAIHTRRLANQEFPLENEAAFIEIRKISSQLV